MIWRSQRSAKSAACSRENVVGVLPQGREIPFGEMDAIAADFQPALQQIELRAFARAVNSFHHYQGARIRALGGRLLQRKRFSDGESFWRNDPRVSLGLLPIRHDIAERGTLM